MKIGVGLKLGTSLSLTPQLQQAIRMLQLSNLELAQEVQQALNENPLLERDTEDITDITSSEKAEKESQLESSAEASEPMGTDDQLAQTTISDDLAIDTKWEDVYIHEATKWDKAVAQEFDYQGETTESLHSHLQWQMNLARLSPIDQLICQRMLDSLDDKGYLGISLQDLHENLSAELAFSGIDYDLELAELAVVLKRIQQCEPAGVAARDLAECLCIQLQTLHSDEPYFPHAMTLLENHEYLLRNDIKKLMAVTKLSLEDIHSSIALIRELNPYPGRDFADTSVDYQIPDVLVSRQAGGWQVQLNPDTLPKLRVNSTYASMVKRGKHDDTNEYIKSNLQNAKHFIRSIDERNKSLLKVATAIVEKQHGFFEEGVTALKPLVLREIADMVELHESTVSRITTNKYMLTSQGLYELKYFFSSGVGTDAGGECAATAICAMIKELIEAEDNKKPLSDSAITKLLQNQGIDVARRTVAKYRESLGFASSTNRKRLL